jgi:hypothetical protein
MTEPPDPDAGRPDPLARGARALERFLGLVLAFAAGFVVIFGAGIMLAIGGGRDRLGERLIVAVAALFALGAIDTQAARLADRRRPLLAPDPPGYRRYAVWSALGLALAAALLLGLALLLP